jgi:estrone sulfotransferase
MARPSGYLRYLVGLAGMRDSDVLLTSFPRSGNTWIRFFLCNLISLREWEGKPVDFRILNDTMPELGVSNLLTSWGHSTIPRVIKTHRPYGLFLGRAPAVGIIRDPRDVMVSFYYYARDRNRVFKGPFSEFLRHGSFGLVSWFEHYTSWRDRWTITIRYEDITENPVREFDRILELLGVRAPEDVIREAIARSDIREVRKAEGVDASTAHPGARFARSGASGQWEAHFSDEDLMRYQELALKFDAHVYP